RPTVRHRQQKANTACNSILGHLRFSQSAQLFERCLSMLHSQRSSISQMLRYFIAEDFHRAFHTRRSSHSSAGTTTQVSIIEVHQTVFRSACFPTAAFVFPLQAG